MRREIPLSFLQYSRKQIAAGISECDHYLAIANFSVYWQKKDISYCFECQKIIPDFNENWSNAFIFNIYGVDTKEEIPLYIEKLEARLNRICEMYPEIDFDNAAFMLYCSTFDDEVKRILEKK